MGYTHYWRKPNGLKNSKWGDYTTDLREVLAGSEKVLQFECDSPKPIEISGKLVRFNGIDDDGHETFYFTPDAESFAFCKTACKPYDKYVVAALILAWYHFGSSIEISSDGKKADWLEGLELLKGALPNRDFEIPNSI